MVLIGTDETIYKLPPSHLQEHRYEESPSGCQGNQLQVTIDSRDQGYHREYMEVLPGHRV